MPEELDIQDLYEAAIEALADQDADGVRDALRNMLAIAPDDMRTLEIEGDLAMCCGELDKAERYYKKMAATCDLPAMQALASLSRGMIRVHRGEPKQAYDLLKEASDLYASLENRSQWLGTLNVLGSVCMELGHLHEAIETFEQSLLLANQEFEEDPEDDASLYMMAYVRRDLGKPSAWRDFSMRHPNSSTKPCRNS
ncbi:MAG: hypothetical protein R3C05_31615 [Pirellulaceae bacterium]